MLKNLNNTPVISENKKSEVRNGKFYAQRAQEIKGYLDEKIRLLGAAETMESEVFLVSVYNFKNGIYLDHDYVDGTVMDKFKNDVYKFYVSLRNIKKQIASSNYFPLDMTNEETIEIFKDYLLRW